MSETRTFTYAELQAVLDALNTVDSTAFVSPIRRALGVTMLDAAALAPQVYEQLSALLASQGPRPEGGTAAPPAETVAQANLDSATLSAVEAEARRRIDRTRTVDGSMVHPEVAEAGIQSAIIALRELADWCRQQREGQ